MVREVTELVCARARAPEFQTQLCCRRVTEEGRALHVASPTHSLSSNTALEDLPGWLFMAQRGGPVKLPS